MSLWVRYEIATLRVLHASQPPFTGTAPEGQIDVLIARDVLPAMPSRLRMTPSLDEVFIDIPPAEQAEEARQAARRALLGQDPAALTLLQRIERLEAALNLEKGVS